MLRGRCDLGPTIHLELQGMAEGRLYSLQFSPTMHPELQGMVEGRLYSAVIQPNRFAVSKISWTFARTIFTCSQSVTFVVCIEPNRFVVPPI
jgi:hypothetical protein